MLIQIIHDYTDFTYNHRISMSAKILKYSYWAFLQVTFGKIILAKAPKEMLLTKYTPLSVIAR